MAGAPVVAKVLVACFVLGACVSEPESRPPPRDQPDRRQPSPSPPVIETQVITRTLNFERSGTRGRVVHVLPYGRGKGEVGFAEACTPPADCEPPCPCTAPVVPAAFDIDSRGRVWILDTVIPRVTVFDQRSRWRFDVALGRMGHRASDLQLAGGRALALLQDYEFHARAVEVDMGGQRGSARRVREGGSFVAVDALDVVGDRVFGTAFVGPLEDEEVFLELPLSGTGAIVANRVDGWPLLDGTLLYPEYEEMTIPLEFSSGVDAWKVDIRFRLRQRVDDRRRQRKGVVTWANFEIDHHGGLHLLIFSGTFGRHRNDGWWYLKVGPDGTVGDPIRLRDPERDDEGQQPRRLTLDASGEPYAMWTDNEGVVIESLEVLESRSLPSG